MTGVPMIHGLKAFFHDPLPPAPLGFFRVAVAAFLLLQAFFWYPDWIAFLGQDAWLPWEVSRALADDWSIHIEQAYAPFRRLGMPPDTFVMLFFWCYVAAGVGLLVGWHTRAWAILAWFLHWILMASLRTFTYGVDIFLHIALFYMMLLPVAKAFSLDLRQGRATPEPTWDVTLSLRVLQIHLCLVYISAGFEKAVSPEWHTGNVIWRSLVQPDFRQYDFAWLAGYPWLAVAAAWSTIILECGYFVAMWIPRVRVAWLAGIVGLHLGIGLFLGLRMFGLIMILLSLSAFGFDAWQDLARRPASSAEDTPAAPEAVPVA